MSTVYRRLRTDIAEIRLLEIIPQENKEILVFRLHHVNLDEAPKFCAISYAWGKPEDLQPVYVDNHTLWVRANLWLILKSRFALMRYYRRKPRQNKDFDSPYIWVDALCINQSDFQERSSQILLMGRIYRTGHVAVCLDRDDWEIDQHAARVLAKLGHESNEETPTISDDSWKTLYNFFTKGWFSRMWVIQEFMLPDVPDCQIWLTNYILQSDQLWEATHTLFKMNPTCLPIPHKISIRAGMAQYLSLYELKLERMVQEEDQDRDPTFFMTMLWIFRDRLATDPRDKIYSLLGLLESVSSTETSTVSGSQSLFQREKLIIDYEAPVEDIYASLVDYVVSGTRSLNILCASQQPSLFQRSWVPDWAQTWQRYSFLTSNIYKSYHHVSAEEDPERYDASASIPSSVTFSPGRTSLIVEGIRWDRILCLRDTAPFSPKGDLTSERWSNETFNQLPADVKNQLEGVYGRIESPAEFYLATTAGLFDPLRNHGSTYRGYYVGASSQWHEYCALLNYGAVGNEEIPYSDAVELDLRSQLVGYRRKICVGDRGYCGLVPDSAQVGDIVCILFGCDVPVILRECEANKFNFVGESYIHGIMNGEAVKHMRNGEVIPTEFEIT